MQGKSRPAIDHYHNLLLKDISSAEEQLQQLYALQAEHRTTFGGRPLSHSLRPAFVSEEQYIRMQDSVYLIRQAILQIAAAFFNEQKFVKCWHIQMIYDSKTRPLYPSIELLMIGS